ncbi:hypothetical protein XELAEV_18042976mg [Xenopus laevis]|uniref:Uncharacterized protein n=1 Tax=Xenopus laevis TaxID=8355 RepID=A0A974H6I3_XENLA|nr:hypothetical protein XELAEV_18042976mg [Xenopus laevis]
MFSNTNLSLGSSNIFTGNPNAKCQYQVSSHIKLLQLRRCTPALWICIETDPHTLQTINVLGGNPSLHQDNGVPPRNVECLVAE